MYVTILDQSWLSRAEKIRLLEFKIRIDLIEYVARGRPLISVDGIFSYTPKVPSNFSVRGTFSKIHATLDPIDWCK